MKNEISQGAKELSKERKFRKEWQKIATALAALVVFCTTYALILPAITMEKDPVCGFEAHEHGESCYTEQATITMQCSPEIPEGYSISHSHEDICYDADGNLICTLAEVEEHIHSDACYTPQEVTCELEETEGHTHGEECTVTNSTLICTMEEVPGHLHGDDCFVSQQTLTCTLEENEEHAHVDECYTIQTEQVCQLEETEGHTHSDECYLTETEMICTLEESEGHTHSEACTGVQNVLSCGKAETVAHQHDESCLITETAQAMTCELPVHVHEDACYPVEEEESSSEYLCAAGEHTHIESCYDEAGNLICTIPEHIHSAPCVVADYDKTADVETAADWEATLADVELTGDWAVDVLAIAESQLGYQESARNVIRTESGDLKGYSRYGAWYGVPYGDWCAMFVSFCLDYAGVDAEAFPQDANCNSWIKALAEQDLLALPVDYEPQPGDLIFFDFDLTEDMVAAQLEDSEELESEEMVIPAGSDHVGIVVEVIPETEDTPAQIKTIEGNSNNQVQYMTYELDDVAIIAYGMLPQGEVMHMTYTGEDFTVTVTYGLEAEIPENAQLSVREILEGTEEYDTHYQQAVEALMDRSGALTQEDLSVTHARFFDIQFAVDGEKIEPTAPVKVEVSYTDGVEQGDGDNSAVVHFADEGIEILDPTTSGNAEFETSKVDSFEFTQSSFSVSGIVGYAETGVTLTSVNTATRVGFDSVDKGGGLYYVIYTIYNGKAYALTAQSSTTGASTQITVNDDGTVSWTASSSNANMFWTFSGSESSCYVQNVGTKRYLHAFRNSNSDYGTMTSGAYPSALTVTDGTNPIDDTFIAQGNNYYTGFVNSNGTITFSSTNSEASAAKFYVAEVPYYNYNYNVWFDGTNGGMMSYYGADNTLLYSGTSTGKTYTVELPTEWKSSTKYDYKLNGWYDVVNSKYYKPGETVELSGSTVFYADWVALTYDVGKYDSIYSVQSEDTSDFITTDVFDYNVLFDVMSETAAVSISSTSHSETWTLVSSGTVPYNPYEDGTLRDTLNFIFLDYDTSGDISYPNGNNDQNRNQGLEITSGIIANVKEVSGQDLMDVLFNPETEVIGKTYVGTGNYLFQYMDANTSNYDGEHNGYYYLDSRLNAASYNKTDERFYLYSYLERTSDSRKDGGGGQYSDFLPFNSPYIFNNGSTDLTNLSDRIERYTDSVAKPGFEYDAKDAFTQSNTVYSEYGDATTNYFFGIRSNIEFFLPNDSGTKDKYDNYGNISTHGEHMVFEFHGDDDLWVYVDGELLLDVGGMHGIMYGEIDFSTGTVTCGQDGGDTTTRSFTDILGYNIEEGDHILTVYYMERGSSQSNCAIYFNIAPRYTLQITKEDVFTAELLDGTEFTVYTDEDCTQVAQLWASEAAYVADIKDNSIDDTISTITVTNGVASCWGISAGKTYYIRETKVSDPDVYVLADDLLRITLNNRGTASIETTTLHGDDGKAEEGYAVIQQEVDDTNKLVLLTVTNQKNEETIKIRVSKVWDTTSTDKPNSVTVYLTLNGEKVGREVTLSDENGWTYTWTGLPLYVKDADGNLVTDQNGNDILAVYQVNEAQVSGYTTVIETEYDVPERTEWTKVESMEDSTTYLLIHNNLALSYNGSNFEWLDVETAKETPAAQWSVTTNGYGFRLTNGDGYVLTYHRGTASSGVYSGDDDYFYCTTESSDELNQIIYYQTNRLMAHDHDLYFYLDDNGNAVDSDGLVFSLMRMDIVSGTVSTITNTEINDDQTFLTVNKEWADGADTHSGDTVIMELYADGVSTGRTLELNASNNWTGTFDGLQILNGNNEEIVYSVVEQNFPGYGASYSDPVTADGQAFVTWTQVTGAATTTENDITVYRISNGSYSLAATSTGVTAKATDTSDESQLWVLEEGKLKNYSTETYFRATYRSGSVSLSMTNSTNATTVTVADGGNVSMTLNSRNYYLTISGTTVSASTGSSNRATAKSETKTVTSETAFVFDTNSVYRFVYGSRALSVNASGTLVVAANDSTNAEQWWVPVTVNGSTVLKNYNKDVYLQLDTTNSTLVLVTDSADATPVTLVDSKLRFDDTYYLQMYGTSIAVTQKSANATILTATVKGSANSADGTAITVTNKKAYELPKTGSMGTTSLYTLGILLVGAAAIMYIIGRKRKKGGA